MSQSYTTASGLDSTCNSNPRGNLHCYHIQNYSTGTGDMCCWCEHDKPKTIIPPHGPYYQGSCSATPYHK